MSAWTLGDSLQFGFIRYLMLPGPTALITSFNANGFAWYVRDSERLPPMRSTPSSSLSSPHNRIDVCCHSRRDIGSEVVGRSLWVDLPPPSWLRCAQHRWITRKKTGYSD